MIGLCFTALLSLPAQGTPAAPPPAAPQASTQGQAPAPLKSLSFLSQRFPFFWDRTIPLAVELDGLKVNSIYFNRRTFSSWPLKGADFGVRAVVEVTNLAAAPRVPGFALAVFDAENRLLGVASGGTGLFAIRPGDTTTFDMSFHQVTERLPKGAYFHLSVELAN